MTSTYTPTGNGLCALCDRDVGQHVDPAHPFVHTEWASTCDYRDHGTPNARAGTSWTVCNHPKDHPIHDVGRTLRCPSEITNLDRVTIYPEVSGD